MINLFEKISSIAQNYNYCFTENVKLIFTSSDRIHNPTVSKKHFFAKNQFKLKVLLKTSYTEIRTWDSLINTRKTSLHFQKKYGRKIKLII